ncbi:MAG: threonine synthase [Myxococcota bacterium]|nr:threonine synthase [Myxococcota bacterium]
MTRQAQFSCIRCHNRYALDDIRYNCGECGALLEVSYDPSTLLNKSPEEWRRTFQGRLGGQPGPHGSGVWRFKEWVLPDIPNEDIVTLGEGATALVNAPRLSENLGIELLTKECGHTLTGSFKDLGMTVLVSQVQSMRRRGIHIPAIACASTGDTSAALAAYGAAAGIPTLVLLPKGKISAAQLVQPLSHGAKVIAIDSDFDGCMKHVQALCEAENVYLANSKNSLRIEGQKTVALEIAQGLGWNVPNWVVIPGGNLGNVSALYKGFQMLKDANLISKIPRFICAQAEKANPLFNAFQSGFKALKPIQAQETQASAIRIGNPVSYPKAVKALQATDGIVMSISEEELTCAALKADAHGLYLCPHTAVAMAATEKGIQDNLIQKGEQIVVISTAHGLKFTEFKTKATTNEIPDVDLGQAQVPREVADDFDAVRKAALGA